MAKKNIYQLLNNGEKTVSYKKTNVAIREDILDNIDFISKEKEIDKKIIIENALIAYDLHNTKKIKEEIKQLSNKDDLDN